jgi:hypothetical protein
MRQLPLFFAITRGRLFKMIPVKQPQRLFVRMKKAVLREDIMMLTQDVTQALVLGQMLYWTKTLDTVNNWIFEENKRLAESDLPQHEYNYGWIYKSAREMREDLMCAFSEDAIQRAFSTLVTKGVFMTRSNPRVRYDRTLQYRIDLVFLRRLLKDRGYEMTDFQLATIPQEAVFIPQGAVSMPQDAEAITEIKTKIKNKEVKPLTPFQGEEENSAMASSSTNDKTSNGFQTSELFNQQTTPPNPPKGRKPRVSKPVDTEFLAELQKLNPDKDVEKEAQNAQSWLLAHPDRKYTRAFLTAWVIRSKNVVDQNPYRQSF